jgi:hypothetical protein
MTAPSTAPTHNAAQRFPSTITDATVEKVSRFKEPSEKDQQCQFFQNASLQLQPQLQ